MLLPAIWVESDLLLVSYCNLLRWQSRKSLYWAGSRAHFISVQFGGCLEILDSNLPKLLSLREWIKPDCHQESNKNRETGVKWKRKYKKAWSSEIQITFIYFIRYSSIRSLNQTKSHHESNKNSVWWKLDRKYKQDLQWVWSSKNWIT